MLSLLQVCVHWLYRDNTSAIPFSRVQSRGAAPNVILIGKKYCKETASMSLSTYENWYSMAVCGNGRRREERNNS